MYEISEKEALKKIQSKNWIPALDEYYQKSSDHSWYNIKDPERDWIFKEDAT